MNRELDNQIKSAVAVVRFTGLGLVSLQEGKESALETLFIHAKNHKLDIKIWKSVSKESDFITKFGGKMYEPLKGFNFEDLVVPNLFGLHSQVSIKINGLMPDKNFRGLKKFGSKKFDRADKTADKNDIGWLINLEKEGLLGDDNPEPKANCNYPRSLMTIENSLVFTETIAKTKEKKSTDLTFHKVIEPDSRKSLSKEDLDVKSFGKIAEYVGAAVSGNAVEIEISFNNQNHYLLLSKTSDPYLIEISNNAENMESDMDVYREFWEETTGNKYNLLTTEEINDLTNNSMGGDSVGVRRICALAAINQPSVKTFTERNVSAE